MLVAFGLLFLYFAGEPSLETETPNAFYSAAWNPNNKDLAVGSGEAVAVYDEHFNVSSQFLVDDPALSLTWNPSGNMLAGRSGDRLFIFQVDGQQAEKYFDIGASFSSEHTVAWSPNGELIAAVNNDRIQVFLVDSNEGGNVTLRPVIEFSGHRNWIISIAWNDDGTRLASSSRDGEIRIWSVDTGELVYSLKHPKGNSPNSYITLAWSNNGNYLASTNTDNRIRIWDAITFQEIRSIESRSNQALSSVNWSSDDSWLIATDGVGVQMWDVETGMHISDFNGHQGDLLQVFLSPGNDKIAGTSSTSIWIWDVASAELTASIELEQ